MLSSLKDTDDDDRGYYCSITNDSAVRLVQTAK